MSQHPSKRDRRTVGIPSRPRRDNAPKGVGSSRRHHRSKCPKRRRLQGLSPARYPYYGAPSTRGRHTWSWPFRLLFRPFPAPCGEDRKSVVSGKSVSVSVSIGGCRIIKKNNNITNKI